MQQLRKVAYALQLLAEPERSVSSIAKLLGVCRTTLYKALPTLTPPQSTTRPTPQLPATPTAAVSSVR